MGMFGQRQWKRLLAAGLFLSFAGGGIGLSWADQTLTSDKDPLEVKLTTALDAETAKFGDPFEAVLTEAYHYEDKQLPAGTVFKGRVHSARASLPFAMPGYVVLDVQQATLPSGTVHQFLEDDSQAVHSEKVIHPKAKTLPKLVKSAIPFSVVSLADSIPLKLATSFTPLQIVPISLGARLALGGLLELTDKEKKEHTEKNHSPKRRLGHGLLRGTGIAGAYYFIHPSPEPELGEGKTIPLKFDKKDLVSLFAAGSTTAGTGNTQGATTTAAGTDVEASAQTTQTTGQAAGSSKAAAEKAGSEPIVEANAEAAGSQADAPSPIENEEQTFSQVYGQVRTDKAVPTQDQ